MSYLVLASILLVIMLSFVALFDEARERVRSMKQRSEEIEKQKRIEQAFSLRGQLHKMDPKTFQKWIAHIYEEHGHRTKVFVYGREECLLLEKNGVQTLVGCKNYVWPTSREVLEILYSKTKQMGLDHLVVISTSGFNLNAWEWATERSGVELVSEEKLFELCEGLVFSDKNKSVPTNTSL